MDPGLTIAGTLTAGLAAVSAGLFCLKKCPPGKAMVIVRGSGGGGDKAEGGGGNKREYKIVTSGQVLLLPGIEQVFYLDLTAFEVLVTAVLPPQVAPGVPLYLHVSLRLCIENTPEALEKAAAQFDGMDQDQIAKKVSSYLETQTLAIENLPKPLHELGDNTTGGEQLRSFWNKSLSQFGMTALKYEFSGLTDSTDALPHTPYTGEDAISQLGQFLDFQQRHEHFEVVVNNPQRFDSQIITAWSLSARVSDSPGALTLAAKTFLGKDGDDVKTMITEELVRVVDNALLISGTYGLLAHLEREAEKIGLGKAKTTKQFVLRAINALAEQSLSWRGKLAFIRFVLSGLKVGQQLHDNFLKRIRSRFSDWGLELVEISLGDLDLKNLGKAQASDGTIEIAETEVCAKLEARWPITVIETREALVHVNVCLKNENKSDDLLQPISEELKIILTRSLESALNSNRWREVFKSIESLMAEIGPEELERGNLRTDRALEELVERIGVTSFYLKLARILLTGLEAYGEARRRFIAISADELRKRGLAIGTFAVVNIDLDRDL